jgi:hypothetical protein
MFSDQHSNISLLRLRLLMDGKLGVKS